MTLRVPVLGLLVLCTTACGISGTMPGFRSTPPRTLQLRSGAVSLPARRAYSHRQRINVTHDTTTNQTRLSVTTHKGMYLLWIQKPRLTFFYDVPAETPAVPPAAVSLLFRTNDPALPASNRLSTTCDGTTSPQAITPTYWFEIGPLTSANLYTYDLPLDLFVSLLGCRSLTITVGDIGAPVNAEQMDALRDLASRMAAG